MKNMKFVLLILAGLYASCADYDTTDITNPKPVNLWMISVTDTTATIRWSMYTNDDFRTYKVYYDTNDIVDTNSILSDSLGFSIDTTKIIKHLKQNTQYYFRVIVYTVNKMIAQSNTVDTVTLKDTTKDTVLSFSVDTSSVTDSTAILFWKKIPMADQYKIYMDTTSVVDSTDTLVKTVTDTFFNLTTKHNPFWVKVYALKTGVISAISTMFKVVLK